MANTPKGQRTRQKQFGKWLRKEPKNIEDFFRTEGRIRSSQNKLTVETARKHFLAEVSRVRRIVDNTNGEGYHIIFPLTMAASTGEFIKGILQIIAPKARVSFLFTSKGSGPDERDIAKILSPLSKHIRIVDYFSAGFVIQAIRKEFINADKLRTIQSIRPRINHPDEKNEMQRIRTGEGTIKYADFKPTRTELNRFAINKFFSPQQYVGSNDPRTPHSLHWKRAEVKGRDRVMDPKNYWQYVQDRYPKLNDGKPLEQATELAKQHNTLRRRLYQLGIAYAKEYQAYQNARKPAK